MKHNYFHYCISVRLGKGERNAKCRREKSREMAEQRARKTKKDRRGENTWMERKTEKPFTQEKALGASWLNWQKMSNLSETVRHVCLGFKQALGALVSIYILQIKKLILIFIGFEAATSPFPHSMSLLVSARSCWSHWGSEHPSAYTHTRSAEHFLA